MRFDRMSGLDAEQLDELEYRVSELLREPWDKGTGRRPRGLTLREALIVASGYMRNNITEEIWAEIFGVDQSTISRSITFLTPLIEQATEEFRPSADEAAEAVKGRISLVDGTLWPCWSWAGERELWSGKYKTTGHGSLIITNRSGDVVFVSESVPGNRHDMAKLKDRDANRSSREREELSATRGSSVLITSLRRYASRKAATCTSASTITITRSVPCELPWNAPLPISRRGEFSSPTTEGR